MKIEEGLEAYLVTFETHSDFRRDGVVVQGRCWPVGSVELHDARTAPGLLHINKEISNTALECNSRDILSHVKGEAALSLVATAIQDGVRYGKRHVLLFEDSHKEQVAKVAWMSERLQQLNSDLATKSKRVFELENCLNKGFFRRIKKFFCGC